MEENTKDSSSQVASRCKPQGGVVVQVRKYGWKPDPSDEREITPERLEYRRVYEQNERCFYTGEILTRSNVALDHYEPLVNGGKHVMGNVVLCTKQANSMKGRLNGEEFLDFCMRVAAYEPLPEKKA